MGSKENFIWQGIVLLDKRSRLEFVESILKELFYDKMQSQHK